MIIYVWIEVEFCEVRVQRAFPFVGRKTIVGETVILEMYKSPEVTIHRWVKVTDKRIGGAQPQGTNRHVCRFDQPTERWNRGKRLFGEWRIA